MGQTRPLSLSEEVPTVKRTLVYGTATALVALSLGGCARGGTAEQASDAPATKEEMPAPTDQPTPGDNSLTVVYGPPPWMEDEGEDDYAVPKLNEPDEGHVVVLYGAPPLAREK